MFGAPVTTAPAADRLITTESAKTFLRVDSTAFDTEIDMLAAAAVEDLESTTGLRLLNQTVEVTADCFADLAAFKVGPIRAVTSIAYRDVAGDDAAIAEDAFELFGAPLEQGVRAIESWPVAEPGSITVTLDVGYGAAAEDVPNTLRFAAYALLRGKFENVPVDIGPLIVNSRFWL